MYIKNTMVAKLAAVVVMAVTLQGYAAEEAKKDKEVSLQDLQQFTTVIENIKNYYVKEVSDKDLFEQAIKGMLAGLDPHSAYLDESDFSDLKVSTTGKFGGLGIEVTMEDGLVKVVTPIDDTPATKAGIKAGDLIVRLGETPVKGLTLRQAVDAMRGPAGSPVELTIIREGEKKPLVIKLVRELIQVASVKDKVIDNSYGYLRISQFQVQTSDDVIKAIKDLQEKAKPKLNGIILDLRNNPGGVLDASVKVADLFLDKNKIGFDKVIVYTEGRIPGSQIKERSVTADMTKGLPMVVLVNEGSASASEIVAGSLQDHKRALVVGKKTFGKGSVQTVLPLKDKKGLKLTTALYFTPSGRSIQATGIVPDVDVEALKVEKSEDPLDLLASLDEADLAGHLKNGRGEPDVKSGNKSTSPTEEDGTPLAIKDFQLYQALQLLKGVIAYKPKM